MIVAVIGEPPYAEADGNIQVQDLTAGLIEERLFMR